MFEFPEVLIIGVSVYKLVEYVQSEDITAEKFSWLVHKIEELTNGRSDTYLFILLCNGYSHMRFDDHDKNISLEEEFGIVTATAGAKYIHVL